MLATPPRKWGKLSITNNLESFINLLFTYRMPEMLDVTTPDVTTPVYPYSQKKRKRLLEL